MTALLTPATTVDEALARLRASGTSDLAAAELVDAATVKLMVAEARFEEMRGSHPHPRDDLSTTLVDPKPDGLLAAATCQAEESQP